MDTHAISYPSPPLLTRQGGVSLLEVLIAVLVLSFGLLGLASLQMTTLRNNQSAFERSRVIMSVYSFADIMRADIQTQGILDTEAEGSFSQSQLATWKENLAAHLGDGASAEITCDAPQKITTIVGEEFSRNKCTVTITWTDTQGLEGGEKTLTTEVQL